ncbi:unnamed protein product [Ectocarpus sp. 8 AP-2014]
MLGSKKFITFIGNVVWVLTTCKHARLLLEALPGRWFRPAIPISIVISSVYGRIAKEEMRLKWEMELSYAHLALVGVVTATGYLKEVPEEFQNSDDFGFEGIARHFYVHFGLWVCLALKATDLSQVVLPMMLLVRPFHCIVLLLTLKRTLPRVGWV